MIRRRLAPRSSKTGHHFVRFAPRPTSTNVVVIPSPADRTQLQQDVQASEIFERRMMWREHPDDWCRERVKIEPSWKVLAARSLGMTLEQFERKHAGELEDKLVEVLYSVRDNRKTFVQSGHKVGKTIIAACVVLWTLDCWRPSKVVTTSASWSDVRMKLWGHIRGLYRQNSAWFGVPVTEVALRIGDDHYAVGLSTEKVEPFQGHNSPHTTVVFDEGSSIEQKFFDAAEAQAHRMLVTGNPLTKSGPFYQFSRSKEWHKIHISCLDHPNVKFGREIILGGPVLEWVLDRQTTWGVTNPLYQVRVVGEFPDELSDTLFPLATIYASFDLYRHVKDLPSVPGLRKVLGLDVARQGGDRTVGYLRDWVLPRGYEQPIPRVRRVLLLNYTEHHETRMKVGGLKQTLGIDLMNVDADGEGSGLADELAAMTDPQGFPYNVNRVMFGANPSHPDYFDVRSEMGWQLSDVMKPHFDVDGKLVCGLALEPDDDVANELAVVGSLRGYREKSVGGTKRLVMAIPEKSRIKEKLGCSPDLYDGLCLCNYQSVPVQNIAADAEFIGGVRIDAEFAPMTLPMEF